MEDVSLELSSLWENQSVAGLSTTKWARLKKKWEDSKDNHWLKQHHLPLLRSVLLLGGALLARRLQQGRHKGEWVRDGADDKKREWLC